MVHISRNDNKIEKAGLINQKLTNEGMYLTTKQLKLSDLLDEYQQVAGQLSMDGIHLEPVSFIKALLQDEGYPVHITVKFSQKI